MGNNPSHVKSKYVPIALVVVLNDQEFPLPIIPATFGKLQTYLLSVISRLGLLLDPLEYFAIKLPAKRKPLMIVDQSTYQKALKKAHKKELKITLERRSYWVGFILPAIDRAPEEVLDALAQARELIKLAVVQAEHYFVAKRRVFEISRASSPFLGEASIDQSITAILLNIMGDLRPESLRDFLRLSEESPFILISEVALSETSIEMLNAWCQFVVNLDTLLPIVTGLTQIYQGLLARVKALHKTKRAPDLSAVETALPALISCSESAHSLWKELDGVLAATKKKVQKLATPEHHDRLVRLTKLKQDAGAKNAADLKSLFGLSSQRYIFETLFEEAR